jgi:5-methylcytosine-specific restriction endonuclease McrA
VWDYDHIDGNRSNNKISNCQALCPNCHAKKTRGLLKQDKSSRRGIIIAIVFIMLFLAMVTIIL